jgi:hypothetical protein
VHKALSAAFFTTYRAIGNGSKNKLEAVANGAMKFLSTDFAFTVTNVAMMLRAVGKCTMMPEISWPRWEFMPRNLQWTLTGWGTAGFS